MRPTTGFSIALVALFAATAATAASDFKIKPGMWQFTRNVTSYSEHGRSSAISGYPNSSTSCEDDGKGLLAEPRHSYCRIIEKSFNGGRVNGSEQCQRGGATTMFRYSGRVSFQEFHITERMTVTDSSGVVVRRMETQLSGRWIGQCRR